MALAALATLLSTFAVAAPADGVKTWTVHYRAHNGAAKRAYVLLPAWYGPRENPPLPLVISPHGRGLSGRANAAIWGALPARGWFAVVNPDAQGRRLARYSWGYPGHVDDLARLPRILGRALPWLRIDSRRIYAFGGSMGGQEALLLLARRPRLLAGVAAFDSVTDFALQYDRFARLACAGRCRRAWREEMGAGLQKLARLEVGGSPRTAPRAYAARSPLAYAPVIAASCVPLQLWWSVADRIVSAQDRQSGRLFRELRRLNPSAPVHAFVGTWAHSAEMHARAQLPLALATFGLLPEPAEPRPGRFRMVSNPVSPSWCAP